MTLQDFIDETEARSLSLVLVNYDAPEPLRSMFEGVFEDQSIDVTSEAFEEAESNMVYLVDDDDGVVATSPLSAIRDTILLTNSDRFVTGRGGIDALDLPAVIEALTDTTFNLRGYPESNKEKLLLILVSRYIERLSLERDGGRHRASFQRLSRINDERGTRVVYDRLADSGTDTHVYGIPDWRPEPEFDVTMHGGWSEDFQDSWFVLHVPDDEDAPHAALVALETEPRHWDGFWTYDASRVRAINDYVERTL